MDIAKILSTFRLVASEFENVSDENVTTMIELQGVRISPKAFGDKYNLAVAYLTAHAFKVDEMLKGGGASSGGLLSGAITSEKEGNISVGYSSPSTSQYNDGSLYSKTAYGLLFLELRSQCIIPVMTRFTRW